MAQSRKPIKRARKKVNRPLRRPGEMSRATRA